MPQPIDQCIRKKHIRTWFSWLDWILKTLFGTFAFSEENYQDSNPRPFLQSGSWIALWLHSAKNKREGELLLFQRFFKFFTSFYFYFCAQWWKNWPRLKVCITWCWVQHLKFCSWVDSMNLRKFVRMAKWRLIVFLIELELDHFIIFRKLLPGD